MDRANILFPVIEYYLGYQIEEIELSGSIVSFLTKWGRGELQQNPLGVWEITIGPEKVAEIEDRDFKVIQESNRNIDLQRYYNELKELLSEKLSFRSGCLIKDIITSLEYLLVNENIKINEPINVGKFFLFSLENQKEIICLN